MVCPNTGSSNFSRYPTIFANKIGTFSKRKLVISFYKSPESEAPRGPR